MVKYNMIIPNTIKKIADPHHGGFSEWCYYKKKFFIRCKCNKKWTHVKKMHLTPARILTLYKLL